MKQEKNNSQLINQTSMKVEYYTPKRIIDAAWKVLKRIDLDPASSVEANKIIKAETIFTKEDDGLSQKWFGNVWLNHPFGKKSNPLWINKLVHSFYDEEIEEALCITYYCSSERWFTPLLSFPRCVLIPRVNYYSPNGKIIKGVPKGSVITYLGHNTKLFNYVFETLGMIDIPYHMVKDLYNE